MSRRNWLNLGWPARCSIYTFISYFTHSALTSLLAFDSHFIARRYGEGQEGQRKVKEGAITARWEGGRGMSYFFLSCVISLRGDFFLFVILNLPFSLSHFQLSCFLSFFSFSDHDLFFFFYFFLLFFFSSSFCMFSLSTIFLNTLFVCVFLCLSVSRFLFHLSPPLP